MVIERYNENPILEPEQDKSWEAKAVFNGCPVQKDGKIYLLYRALSLLHYHTLAGIRLRVSNIGIAESDDGLNFSKRRRFIVPEQEWEKFGCEDPRITKFDNKYYIFYTALSSWPPNSEHIKVGLAISRDLKNIDEKHLVTPFNAKAMALFPEKIGGKIWTILNINTDRPPSDICLASFKNEKDIWSEKYWQKWYKDFNKFSLPLRRSPKDEAEVGAPPIKTKNGWLLIYSYIRNYFSAQRLFGIEAVLLDLKNPTKIISRTDFPFIWPEEYYETYGLVPNVVFPSGALLKGNKLYLYYGAADTTCNVAFIDLQRFIEEFITNKLSTLKLKRLETNPMISPIINHQWESRATFNPAAIYLDNKIHILYRAMSNDKISTIGYAQSNDGIHIDNRSIKPIYSPRAKFEQKLILDGNSGCEDPRIVKIDDRIYMFYTAFDGKNPPRVSLTWISVKNFLEQKWNWSIPVLISSPNLDDKDATMFPEKINDKYVIIHRYGDDIDLSFHDSLNFDGKSGWLEEYRWIKPRKGWWDSKKVGIAATPIKTKSGWLLLYHGVSEKDNVYRIGAILTDINDPTEIIGRTDRPILEPEKDYEKNGIVNNVVFLCGAVLIKEKLFVYYGGGDKVVCGAVIDIHKLVSTLESSVKPKRENVE